MRRLLIIDAQPIVRCGIEHALRQAGIAVETERAITAAQAAAQVQAERWDGAVIDIGQSEYLDVGFVAELAKSQPKLPILVFTMLPEVPYGRRALSAGAASYLSKSASPAELAQAVERLLAGQQPTNQNRAAGSAAARHIPGPEPTPDSLTARELDVLRQIALGKSIGQIGAALGIHPKTVHTHRANILRKLGVGDNNALARYAFEHRLILERRA